MSSWPTAWVFTVGLLAGAVLLALLVLLVLIFGNERLDRINWRLDVDRQELARRRSLSRVMTRWERQRDVERRKRPITDQIIPTDIDGL